MDHDGRRIVVSMTKDQVKAAPDYDESEWANEDTRAQQRARHGDYYTTFTDR
jgi:stress response protein YsnF